MSAEAAVEPHPAAGHGTDAMLSEVETATSFTAERLGSAAELLELADGLGGDCFAAPFQRRGWLEPWYATLGRRPGVTPCPLAVRDGSGRIAALFPFVIRETGYLRIIEPADGGITDYNAPILGPAAPATAAGAARLWSSFRELRLPADFVRLQRMPATIAGRANPLALLAEARPSAMFGSLIELEGDFDGFLRSRGKHFRKEVNRSFRVLERHGPWRFLSPDDPAEAQRLFAVLHAQQTRRMQDAGKPYMLDRPEVRAHYEQALALGLGTGTARVFALAVGDEIIAATFGLMDGNRFLLLRIANAGEAWKHCSPGRLVVAETMRWLIARGLKGLDMTIGDYPFKRQFDPVPVPLVDLHVALSWRGRIELAKVRAKARARRTWPLRNFAGGR